MEKRILNSNKERLIPYTVIVSLGLFISAITILVWHNWHFRADDLEHFLEVIKLPLPDLLARPIDVHFVPLHQLTSYLIFTAAPLNFNVALGLMVACWAAINLLMYRLLRRFVAGKALWLIVLIFGANQTWISLVSWWSSGAHRLPYLLLQAAAFYVYLLYREQERRRDACLCILFQILAIGFYTKGILFPISLAAFEMCLAFKDRCFSRAGIKVCLAMAAVSALYILWYLLSPRVNHVPITFSLIAMLHAAFAYLSMFGSLLLLLPLDKSWALWLSGGFWLALAAWSVRNTPRNITPILCLLILLIMGFSMSLTGRSWRFPPSFWVMLPVMRYFADELVITAIFVALAVPLPSMEHAPLMTAAKPRFINPLLLALIIIYSAGAYTHSATFTRVHDQRAHDYMVHAMQSLEKASALSVPPKIIRSAFPAFVYSAAWGGMCQSAADIFSPLYPRIEWVTPDQVQSKVHRINEDGNIVPVELPNKIDFRNDISFPDWNAAETKYRWSRGRHATLLFSTLPTHGYEGLVSVKGLVLGMQRVNVRLNGKAVTQLILTDKMTEWALNFSPQLLYAEGINALEFDLQDARASGNGDSRILAIGAESVSIR